MFLQISLQTFMLRSYIYIYIKKDISSVRYILIGKIDVHIKLTVSVLENLKAPYLKA